VSPEERKRQLEVMTALVHVESTNQARAHADWELGWFRRESLFRIVPAILIGALLASYDAVFPMFTFKSSTLTAAASLAAVPLVFGTLVTLIDLLLHRERE
jgi:hypothetical protein